MTKLRFTSVKVKNPYDIFALYMLNPMDVTIEAGDLTVHTKYQPSDLQSVDWHSSCTISATNFSPYPMGSLSERFEISSKGFIEIGDECIDIRNIHNIASFSQLTTIGLLIRKMENSTKDKLIHINEVVDSYLELLESSNLDDIYSTYFTQC